MSKLSEFVYDWCVEHDWGDIGRMSYGMLEDIWEDWCKYSGCSPRYAGILPPIMRSVGHDKSGRFINKGTILCCGFRGSRGAEVPVVYYEINKDFKR
jgi:hypothetical protein